MPVCDLIPTHAVASWLLDRIERLLDLLKIDRSPAVEEVAYVIVVTLLALGVSWLVSRLILFLVRRMVAVRHSRIGRNLLEQHTLLKCSHVIPPIVLLCLLPFAFSTDSRTLHFIQRVISVYGLIMLGVGLTAISRFVWLHYDAVENTRHLPLKGILNIVIGLIWGIVVIVGVSVLIDRSPAALLGGLGAFAAALMLIFKNSILGFVAGIQLSQNDMLRVGDWIEVPGTQANGIVIDVTLSVVKVRNFDNTLIMLPPYSLVDGSFRNWRGMWESGVRCIERAVIIDAASVCSCTDEMRSRLATAFPSLAKTDEETNLGMFRAYVYSFLQADKRISSGPYMLVRLMPQTPAGIPLQLFCFTATTVWQDYEAIQSSVFEHLSAVAPSFGLRIYNYPDSIAPTAAGAQS